MTFTIRHCLAWIALSFAATVIVSLLFGGGWFTLIGLSLALNLYLGWHHYGHVNTESGRVSYDMSLPRPLIIDESIRREAAVAALALHQPPPRIWTRCGRRRSG